MMLPCGHFIVDWHRVIPGAFFIYPNLRNVGFGSAAHGERGKSAGCTVEDDHYICVRI